VLAVMRARGDVFAGAVPEAGTPKPTTVRRSSPALRRARGTAGVERLAYLLKPDLSDQ
jgi:hypothetical protein